MCLGWEHGCKIELKRTVHDVKKQVPERADIAGQPNGGLAISEMRAGETRQARLLAGTVACVSLGSRCRQGVLDIPSDKAKRAQAWPSWERRNTSSALGPKMPVQNAELSIWP